MNRAREVAVRKTLGAARRQLVQQFIGESFLVSFIATIAAIALVQIFLPQFTDLTGVDLSAMRKAGWLLAAIAALPVLVGLAAGSYPAFYLSHFQPIKILKSGVRAESPRSASVILRKSLVMFQFTVSIALIIGAQVIARQLDFIQNRKLGLETEQVVVIPINGITAENYSAIKTALLNQSGVASVTASLNVPGERIIYEKLHPENAREESYLLRLLLAEFDFPETYGLTLHEGRSFSPQFSTDSSGAFLLNEKAVALFGWDRTLGKRISFPSQNRSGEVVGVVKNFNFASLHSEIEPLAILLSPNPNFYKYISIRLRAGNKREAINAVERVWKAILPGAPLEYYFLDESFESLYRAEMRLQSMVTIFTAIGILIACLGLFGLVSQATEQRTKEIGVRKVLGASVSAIVSLVSKDFVKLIGLSYLVACPVAYLAMNHWLQDFAYRIDIGWWTFLLAGGLALLIALLTVSTQAIKAALANPVEALRYE
jgi:putative ABC transport system permease protein